MTTKNEILRRVNRLNEKYTGDGGVMIFDSQEEYDNYTGPAPDLIIIDDVEVDV